MTEAGGSAFDDFRAQPLDASQQPCQLCASAAVCLGVFMVGPAASLLPKRNGGAVAGELHLSVAYKHEYP